MTAAPDQLTSRDQREIAAMHRQILPGSLVSRLGARYARSFYAYVARSPLEDAFVHKDGDALLAGCIVTSEPETLKRRLLFATPVVLHAPLALGRLPLRAMIGGFFGSAKSEIVQPPGPEVLLIFTQPAARGSGLGAALLRRCEGTLRDRGHRVCHVKTVASAENRAIAFYLREGFEERGVLASDGKQLLLLTKPL